MSIPARPAVLERMVGFDNVGEVFVSGDRLLRGIYPGHAANVRDVLGICEASGLFGSGLIETREVEWNERPELGYDMVLEHRRLPFVTYPHEWPASMLKEAAIFHVEMYKRLGSAGLTLKDWHPYNVLFDGTRPVFVDFTSIVRLSDLSGQPHLAPTYPSKRGAGSWDDAARAVYQMYRLMFEPYFGLPLVMMERQRHALARSRLFETTLNTADDVISRREAFEGDLPGRLLYEIEDRLRMRTLSERESAKPRFFDSVSRMIRRKDVALKGSAYSTYYEDKAEVFDTTPGPEWTAKQHGVHQALSRLQPATVLDLGSNTGWFSILAARLGSAVVSADLDEASVERLYASASRDGLNILPLVVNLTQPLPELFARTFENEPSLSLIGEHAPVVSSPGKRLRCDMVLALAVTHHMSLGQGLTLAEVAALLSGLAERYLCVEFVSMNDSMIVTDPGFFPAYAADPRGFAEYSEENFVTELSQYFSIVDNVASHPGTRRLLICSR